MTIRWGNRMAAGLALAACMTMAGGLGCGGGDRAKQTTTHQAPPVEPVAGKADAVTVSYYYLPG